MKSVSRRSFLKAMLAATAYTPLQNTPVVKAAQFLTGNPSDVNRTLEKLMGDIESFNRLRVRFSTATQSFLHNTAENYTKEELKSFLLPYAQKIKAIADGFDAVNKELTQDGTLKAVLEADDNLYKQAFGERLRMFAHTALDPKNKSAIGAEDSEHILLHAKNILAGKLPASLDERIKLEQYLSDHAPNLITDALYDAREEASSRALQASRALISNNGFKPEMIEFLQEGEVEVPWAATEEWQSAMFRIPISKISNPNAVVKKLWQDFLNIYSKDDNLLPYGELDPQRLAQLRTRIASLRNAVGELYQELSTEIFPGIELQQLDFLKPAVQKNLSGEPTASGGNLTSNSPVTEKGKGLHTQRLSKKAAVSFDDPTTPGKQNPGWEWP